ncbi:MAG: hypothetical protein GY928_05690 [Colwellia sp.]|nr:hypothetical protein [Colwellia sp.]
MKLGATSSARLNTKLTELLTMGMLPTKYFLYGIAILTYGLINLYYNESSQGL